MPEMFVLPFRPAYDRNGRFIPGAKAWFTLTGTNTPTPVYTNALMTIPHANPLVANAAGRFDVAYLDDAVTYRLRIYDEDGVVGVSTPLEEYDPYTGAEQGSIGATGPVGSVSDGSYSPEAYGALGDGTTDDAPAFNAMIAAMPNTGGVIRLGRKAYKLNSRVTVSKSVTIIGVGAGTRSWVFGETQTAEAWAGYTGTVLVVASSTAGLFFPWHTDVEDTNTAVANRGATASNATYWEYPGAMGARMSGVVLYSLGGTSVTAHGIEARVEVHFDDIIVYGFGGNGLHISASADVSSAGSAYGLADCATFKSCQALQNRGNGFHVIGRDVNIINFDDCQARLNGGWGFNDEGAFGNNYIGCHAATNNTLAASFPARGASANASIGSFRSTSTAAPNIYLGCYAEEGNGTQWEIAAPSRIDGGILSAIAGTGGAQQQRGPIIRGPALTHYNIDPALTFDLSADLGGTTTPRLLAWGTNENGEDLASGDRSLQVLYYSGQKVYSWEPPGYSQGMYLNMPTLRTQSERLAAAFPGGLFLGTFDASMGPRGPYIGFGASVGNGIYRQGDKIINTAPTANGTLEWVCTASGTKAAAWVTGTTYYINNSLAITAHITNANKVYRISAQGGGTSTVAPTHASGTVVGADGYGWTFLNADTVPTFDTVISGSGSGSGAGNIGLFTAASGTTISAGTNVVRTSGYNAVGNGIADYIYDATVSAATVTAHPRAAFLAADGRGFRLAPGEIDIRAFGAIADGIGYNTGTDNSPAINAALAYGLAYTRGVSLYVPKAFRHYRCSSPITLTEHTKLRGDGYGQNAGVVGGVTYATPQNYYGSVLAFDTDVAGLSFVHATDDPGTAPVWEYQSSTNSVLEDIMLSGAGGTGTTAHGVTVYSVVYFKNVRIQNFAGNGLNITAQTGGTEQYGNADSSAFYSVMCRGNLLHGVYIEGNDANVLGFYSCDFANNGGCGSLDTTNVGNNSFYTCHYATNNRSWAASGPAAGFSVAQRNLVLAAAPFLSDQYSGSLATYRGKIYDNTDIGNLGVYSNCYIEGGTGSKARLRHPTTVYGGFLAQTNVWHSEWSANTQSHSSLRNYVSFYNVSQGASFNFHDGDLHIKKTLSTDTNIPTIVVAPQAAVYSRLQLQGNLASSTLGAELMAGNNGLWLSARDFTFRNQAQTSTYLTMLASGALFKIKFGYDVGAGGTVTQATSKVTGATLNTASGQVTMAADSLAANTAASFTLTNSKIVAGDVIMLSIGSGATAGAYAVLADAVAAGSCRISLRNLTAGALAEAVVLNFAVIKGATT